MRVHRFLLRLTPRTVFGALAAFVILSTAVSYLTGVFDSPKWSVERVGSSAVQGSFRFETFRVDGSDVTFTVQAVSFDRTDAAAMLVDLPTGLPGSLEDQRRTHDAQAIINGGFFDPDFKPVGAFRIEGRQVSEYASGSNVAAMAAVFEDGRLRVLRAEGAVDAGPNLMQTGPILVLDDGTRAPLSKHVQAADRSGVAQDDDRVCLFTTTPVSLADLADAMHACPEAFGLQRITFATALDGGPSSGMAARIGGHEYVKEPRGRIRNAIVVRTRNP